MQVFNPLKMNNMLRNKFSFKGLLFIMLLLISCHDELLDPIPESVLTTTNFYRDANDLNLAVIGVYSKLQSDYPSYYNLMELTTDNVYLAPQAVSPATIECDVMGITPANDIVAAFWEDTYNGIFRANSVLANIDKPADYKPDQKDQLTGEAKFLRAYFYFNLVRIFGDVPKVTTSLSINEARNTPRASESEIYDLIIDDLKDAISKLPVSIDKGRASKGAAVGLLAKVYVFRKDWNNAKIYLEQLFNEFNYSLLNDFSKVIKTEDHSEIIFAIKYIDGTNGQLYSWQYVPYSGVYGVISSGVSLLPAWSLHKLYEPGDTRKASTIEEWWKPWSAKAADPASWYPYVTKFQAAGISTNVGFGLDLIVLRLADMILLYSEVLYELQQPDAAIVQINRIRQRAFGNTLHNYTLADVPSREAFMDKLFLERRLELAFENERWFDLVRSGKLVEKLTSYEALYNYATQKPVMENLSVKSHMEKFPVPQRQIDQSNPGVLTQNAGY
jgi:hypothetical protein